MANPVVPHVTAEEIARIYGISLSKARIALMRAEKAMTPISKEVKVVEDKKKKTLTVTRQGVGVLTTPHGEFWQYDFRISDDWEKYSVLVHCDLFDENFMPFWSNQRRLVMRTDSGCETGQVFHDATCECREQLHLAMQQIVQAGEGMIVNIPRQDGRGKGLPFKLSTLLLQKELGVNTVESASMLALDGRIDVRTYAGVIGVLKFFNITPMTTISLATNNPFKSNVFIENGYSLDSFKPVVVAPTEHTARHLAAKHQHLGHQGIGFDVNGDGIVDFRITPEEK